MTDPNTVNIPTDVTIPLMQEVLTAMLDESGPGFPKATRFRIAHEADRVAIDRIVRVRDMKIVGEGHYVLTMNGLRACGSEEAMKAISQCSELVETLKRCYRSDPDRTSWTAEDISAQTTLSAILVSRLLVIMIDFPGIQGSTPDSTGAIVSLALREQMLDGDASFPALPQARLAGPGDEHGKASNWDEDGRYKGGLLSPPPEPEPMRQLAAGKVAIYPKRKPGKPKKKASKKAAKKKPTKKGKHQ